MAGLTRATGSSHLTVGGASLEDASRAFFGLRLAVPSKLAAANQSAHAEMFQHGRHAQLQGLARLPEEAFGDTAQDGRGFCKI